jgi:hypothetical protein
MSTNATISVITPEGKVLSVYNHWDGYPDYLLDMLTKHYNTLTDAMALVKPGNISSVRERCDGDVGHTFNNPIPDQTIYYGRDRGEKNQEPMVQDLATFDISKHLFGGRQEYNYIFANGQWMHLHEWEAEQEATNEVEDFVGDVVEQIRDDLKRDETGAVYELIEYLHCLANPAVDDILKNYLPQD